MTSEQVPAAELGAGDYIIHEGAEWHISVKRRYSIATGAREYVLTSDSPKVHQPLTVMLADHELITRTRRWK